MNSTAKEAVNANAEFITDIMSPAAKFFKSPESDRTPLVDVLQQARDEFLKNETKGRKNARTYYWATLLNDLKWYLVNHEAADPDSFSPITDWEQVHAPTTVADTLLQATEVIKKKAQERTITMGRVDAMTEKEFGEHMLMQATAEFLTQQGLNVQMSREWEDPSAPLDYRGTVDGTPWAFELTAMREDPKKDYHRKTGHPKEKKSPEEQLENLQKPLPQIPDGSEALQRNLNKAIEHGRKRCKVRALDGAKYCLVIHNPQYLYIPDWQEITCPSLEGLDAVMLFHEEIVPPARVWQVIPPDAFGKTVKGGTVEDLEKLALTQQTGSPDPRVVKEVWQRLDELNISEKDILEAIEQAKRTG